jgi:hypothetical protein
MPRTATNAACRQLRAARLAGTNNGSTPVRNILAAEEESGLVSACRKQVRGTAVPLLCSTMSVLHCSAILCSSQIAAGGLSEFEM